MLIDTHAAVRELEAAGLQTAQAEAIVKTIAQVDEQIATKGDIATLRSEMRWMFGFLAALLLAIAARVFGLV